MRMSYLWLISTLWNRKITGRTSFRSSLTAHLQRHVFVCCVPQADVQHFWLCGQNRCATTHQPTSVVWLPARRVCHWSTIWQIPRSFQYPLTTLSQTKVSKVNCDCFSSHSCGNKSANFRSPLTADSPSAWGLLCARNGQSASKYSSTRWYWGTNYPWLYLPKFKMSYNDFFIKIRLVPSGWQSIRPNSSQPYFL